jgi:TP901 family phage tail tape measure protein
MSEDFASIGMQIDTTDLDRANKGLGTFGQKVKGAQGDSDRATKSMASNFKSVALAVGAAVSALASIGGAISVIRQFESSMSQVAAITRASTEDLKAMRDVAKQLGSTTEFTAAQAADGLKFLGMAGFTARESIAAIPAVLDLATAAAMDLAQTADIASNVISGFGLAAGQAGEVADVLAAASSRANTSVSQLGRAMSTVAPISAALGIDLADTAAAIGVLSDAGIQGERAGTALRGVMASLAGPTTQAQEALAQYGITAAQVNPETQSLTEIFGLLRERGLSTADAMTIFGREAASGALVLTEASARVGEFGEELRNVEGATSEMAEIMRDNLAGSANTALSALQGLAVAIGEAGLTAVLRAGLQVVTDFARELTSLTTAVSDFFTRHDPMTESVAAAAVAMNEEARQALQLSNRLLEMGEVSYDVLGAKVALVETTLRQIEADRQANIMAVKQTEEYERLQGRITHAREALEVYADLARAGIELNEDQVLSLSGMTEVLRDAVARQQEMVDEAGAIGPAFEQANAELNLLKAYLADAEGGTVNISQNVEDVGAGLNFAQRVANFFDGYLSSAAGNANAAKNNVSALGQMLNGAAAAARALAGAMASAASTLGPLGSALSSLGGGGLLGRVNGAAGGILGNIINSDAVDAAGDRLSQLGSTMRILFERSKAAAVAQDQFASAVDGAGGAAGGAAKQVDKFADEIARLEDAADPTREFRREMEKLDTLLENGLSDGAYAAAVEDLNAQFVETSPILSEVNDAFGQMVDYMFDGFKDGMKGILNIFVNSLKSMAAAALKNKITIGLGIGATGAGGAAAAGQGGGILSQAGSLMGGSGFLGLGGGTGSLFGGAGLLGMGGGTGFLGLGAGSGLAGALGGGAFGAAASVALPVIGIGLALVGLFKKTEVLVAEGVRARIEGASLELDSYEKTKQDNAFGMSSGFSRDFDRLDDAVQSVVQTRLDATIDALGAFGLGTDLTGFSFSKRTEIKDGETFEGESEEVIREALSAAIEFATEGALEAFQRSGEEMSDTLDRLTVSFGIVNQAMEMLNMGMINQTLENADMASSLIEMSGGMEAFSGSLTTYYQAFYSEGEQMMNLLSGVQKEFATLGLEVPRTREGFRSMVESLDVTTESGSAAFAMMMRLAGAMDAVYSAASNASSGMAGLAAALNGGAASYASQVGSFAEATFAAEAGIEAAVASARATLDTATASLSRTVFSAVDAADRRLAAAERTMQDALQSLARSISDEIQDLDDMLADAEANLSNSLSDALGAIDRQIDGLADGIDAAGEAADKARNLFEMLRDALDDRRLGTDAETRLRRSRALSELQGGIQDEDRLGKVLSTLNAPSEQLFGSFTDYALDFAKTSAAIRQQRDAADGRMGTAETELEAAQRQVELLEEQKETLQGQYDAIMGLKSSTLSVEAAVQDFRKASASYQDLQAFHTAEVARLEAIRDEFGIVTEASLSVEDAITAYAAASATYADEQAWHTERMGYLQNLIDQYGLQIDSTDAVESAVQAVRDATGAVKTAVNSVETAINNLATAMVGALQNVGGTGMLEGMGVDAFSVFSDDRTNAILSDAAADLLTGTAAALNDAFNTALGRNIDASSLALYGQQLENGRTMAQIMQDLYTSQEAMSGAVAGFTGTSTGFTADNIPDREPRDPLSEVEATMMAYLGHMPTGDYWENFAAETGMTGQALEDEMVARFIENGKIPAFASGGMHAGGLAVVGEEGPELVNMGPSRVWNANQTRDMLSNRELVDEIKALRSEVARLAAYNRQTTINTGDTARRIKDFDLNGLPKERV